MVHFLDRSDIIEQDNFVSRDKLIEQIQDLRLKAREIEDFFLLREFQKKIKKYSNLLDNLKTESTTSSFSNNNFEEI